MGVSQRCIVNLARNFCGHLVSWMKSTSLTPLEETYRQRCNVKLTIAKKTTIIGVIWNLIVGEKPRSVMLTGHLIVLVLMFKCKGKGFTRGVILNLAITKMSCQRCNINLTKTLGVTI